MTPTEAQRLSEQEKILVSRCARGVASVAEGNELAALVDSLARQLAEAERENERLAEDRDYWKRQAHHLLKASMAGRRLRKLLREMGR